MNGKICPEPFRFLHEMDWTSINLIGRLNENHPAARIPRAYDGGFARCAGGIRLADLDRTTSR
jgi:hypothetical protein